MNITNHSKSLRGMLERYLLAADLPTTERAFSIAIEHGGLEEFDFLRPEGQSYNPRPARIAQILIGDDQCTDGDTITAAILYSVNDRLNEVQLRSLFSDTICSILSRCSSDPATLRSSLDLQTISASKIICASWLDRMRHIHLATSPTKELLLTESLLKTDSYIELAEIHSKPIAVLLRAWKDRALRNQR